RDLEVVPPVAGTRAVEALLQRGTVEVVALRSEEDREPTVADLGGHGDVLRALRTEEDGDVLAQRLHDRLERLAEPGRPLPLERHLVVLALEVDLLAAEDPAQHLHVLTRARQRLRVPLAVPTLHDLRSGCAEP